MIALLHMRNELYERGYDSIAESVAYREREGIALSAVSAFAGVLVVTHARFGNGFFDFDDEAEPSAVIEAIEIEDGELVSVDLVAWPLDRPQAFATAFRRARGLGLDRPVNPATFFEGAALRVHRTPLAWLKGGCAGSVVLSAEHTVSCLGDALGRIAGEDLDHARAIGRALHPFIEPNRIGFLREAA